MVDQKLWAEGVSAQLRAHTALLLSSTSSQKLVERRSVEAVVEHTLQDEITPELEPPTSYKELDEVLMTPEKGATVISDGVQSRND